MKPKHWVLLSLVLLNIALITVAKPYLSDERTRQIEKNFVRLNRLNVGEHALICDRPYETAFDRALLGSRQSEKKAFAISDIKFVKDEQGVDRKCAEFVRSL